ncbi:uncharacterized protein KNAG_0D01220 [Huiozyma naganishii CBS 8797]|uniref:Yippee domain-containing protein n=1 Tax=Huiozyma naganishii (strain ATCC MYA-139 / BCRC 22969 / CBS 8797 / KCTC 17520 / NBRC 10181 / NCYC 3082 / Yp74L-3) TaxID=1071383 RepID=J7S5J3_HUIN7|nr:hypothetical protein KNAG_0D01220 [Kazachstania naganishii CBS 8797]CCK69874.1 hypothetical protein KNAG_0D01220 [Kazachstania naganishii CBS 8797]
MGLPSSYYIEYPSDTVIPTNDFTCDDYNDSLDHLLLPGFYDPATDLQITYPRSRSVRLFQSSKRKRSVTNKYKFTTYGCSNCRTHLSTSWEIMSKDYRGKTGDAYLMDNVINVVEANVETRSMITGAYLVCDICCHWCKNVVGWKYLQSTNIDQRYKEGKYILELKTICVCD